MRKWILPLLSVLFASLLFVSAASDIFRPVSTEKENVGQPRILLIQDREKEEKEGGQDTYYIALLKQIREKVDEWLKSLNEKIEREDITRFKVRFYEILRNILEWVKEKLDAKIESSEEQKPKKRDKEGLLRETRQRFSPHFEIG
jgi:predicted RND superfamily exporter protein